MTAIQLFTHAGWVSALVSSARNNAPAGRMQAFRRTGRAIRHLIMPFCIGSIAVGGVFGSTLSDASAEQREPRAAIERETITRVGQARIREVVRAEGADARLIDVPEAGYSFATFPGIKRVSSEELARMREIPETGLFIVDAPYVPFELLDDLRRQNYELQDDGTLLDENGDRKTMFVRPQTFEIIPRTIGPTHRELQRPRPPSQEGDDDASGDRTEIDRIMSPKPRASADGLLHRLTSWLIDGLIPSAHAASPFPFKCVTWYAKWEYDGGFCRHYRAWTGAYAWGPGITGGCSGIKPLTNIQYITAYAHAAGKTGQDYCYNCNQEHAYAHRKIGCFWPAHGKGSGYHYVYLVDGTIQVFLNWGWSH
jgi:hypothetical protein